MMAIKAAKKGSITIDVKDVLGRISPYIYGYFIENLANIVYGGIWAEILRNRKFGVPDFNNDGLSDPWEPIGKDEYIEYFHDPEVFYSGEYSQKMVIKSSDGKERGIAQSRISVIKGRKYTAYLYLKQNDFNGTVTIALGKNEKKIYASQSISKVSPEWEKYTVNLIPNKTDANCKFMILFNGAGTIWIDAVSLMPMENDEGLRKDVIALVKEVDPPVLKWPGGCFADGYHWKDGVGPRDQRPVKLDPAWKCWEANDFGTNEFIHFCKAVGAEPYLCLNFGSGTVEEAAEWVKYCNSASYKIKYWAVGNEICYPTEIGHTDAVTYARKLVDYCKVLKSLDPEIKVSAVGCLKSWPRDAMIETGIPLPKEVTNLFAMLADWNERVLEIAGDWFDFLSVHWYVPLINPVEIKQLDKDRIYHAIVAAPQDLERMLKETVTTIDKVMEGRKDIKIIIDEWGMNLISSDQEKTRDLLSKMVLDGSIDKLRTEFTLRDALFAAGVLNVLQRLCKHIFMANFSTLVNVMGLILVDQTQAIPSALHPVFKVYTKHSGEIAVRATVESPSFNVPRTGTVPSLKNVPYIDCSASLSRDKRNLYIHIVNRHPSEDIVCHIRLLGCSPSEEVRIWEINAQNVSSKNNFKNPNAVRISESVIRRGANDFEYRFPAHSITSMMIQLH